jgi:hypothetical protein
LVPFDPFKVLSRIPQPSPSPPPQASTPTSTTPFDMPSSPPDITVFRNSNNQMRRRLSSNHTIETPVRRHIDRLANHLRARTTVLESQNNDLKKIVGKRQEQANGVRAIIKGKHLHSVGKYMTKLLMQSALLNNGGNQRGISRLTHHW